MKSTNKMKQENNVRESSFSSLSSSLKHHSDKARSLRKAEHVFPNSPPKKVEIVTSSASKLKLCKATPKSKGDRPMEQFREEQFKS